MKRMMFAAMVAAAALAPLAGRADENRLNLWPLVGYNDGAFDFIWPLGHFKDSDEWRFFPIIRDRDLFCVFPELWFTDDGFAVLPLATEYDFGRGTLFPVLWWDLEGSDIMHSVFPAYYYRGNDNATTFWAGCGLAGFHRRDGKFTDHRFLPLYLWDDGDFYSLPYSRYRSGVHLKSRILCGLVGYDSNTNGDYQASWLLPFYSHDKANDEFLTPLYGKTKDANWLIPFYYHDEHLMLTPLFGKTVEANWTLPLYYKDKEKLLTLIGGKDGDTDWVVPFYWRDKKTFASLPYWRQLGLDGEIDRAFSLPLLSGYERDHKSGDRLLYLLVGLGGHVWSDETGGASWVFPLFYKDRESFYTLLYGQNPRRSWLFPVYFDGEERTYITPLYGRNKKKESEWLFPLYWRDKDSFVTPLYGRSEGSEWLLPFYTRGEDGVNTIPFSYWVDAKSGTRGFFSLPLLSGASWEKNSCDYTWFSFAGLVGSSSNASGSRKTNWALPLFVREEGESFYSIPFGWSGGGSAYTNTYFAAGLAGLKSGKTEGGWMFPLYKKEASADYSAKSAWMDAEKLPDDIKMWTATWTNRVWNSSREAYDRTVEQRMQATDVWAKDVRTAFLFSDNDRHLNGGLPYGATNRYEMTERHKLGNKLVFNHESKRKVCFDTATREKVSDSEDGDTSLLMLLYNGEHRSDKAKGTSYASHRVLWKLWDWEEEDGDVALDVFPGFTYDSKKNGYSKTSFLWRFFRYENDPEKGKKVDLLFIPVWR